MATANDIIAYARQIAQTDSNGLTDAQALMYLNDSLQNFTRALINRDVDASQIQEAYTSTVAGQGSYAYPPDKYMLKTIEVNTGTGSQNDYVQAYKVDISNLQAQTSFDWLRLNQTANNPLFNDHGDTFEIFPTPTSAIGAGIKIVYFLIPTEYSSTSSAVSYPVSLDYRALSCRVAALYNIQLEDADTAAMLQKEYQDRLDDIIRILSGGSEQPTQPQTIRLTGFEF